ncbi:SPFH domain-containing protein [Zavarzinia sp.]|uniref:SPFH domain-containing protein n=1 Tax=Zavarzinia sp. TaxID=2027920 RepID=UPI003562B7F8
MSMLNPKGGAGPALNLRRIGLIAGLVAAGTVVMSSFYTVDEGEAGVVLRNGAVHDVATPGLHFKLPLIDQVVTLSTRTEKLNLPQVAAYSQDIQGAELNMSVNYRITAGAAKEIYARLGVNYADRILVPTLLDRTKAVFGRFSAPTIVGERARLVAEITDSLREAVKEEGIIVESVQIENIDFSDAFEQAIEQRMQAEVEVTRLRQNLEREKVQAEIRRTAAQGQADSTVVQARAEADSRALQAKAEADAIRLRGEAEAATLRAKADAMRDNPGLIEMIRAERWDGKLPQTMVPGSAVPFIEMDQGSSRR